MADYFDAGKFGAICAIPFGHADLTTGESDTDLTAEQGSLHVMPQGGSVIGLVARVNASVTSGSAVFQAHKSGTEFTDGSAPSVTCDSSNQGSYASLAPGLVDFDAGDALGISVTTTTDMAPTNSLDVDALLFVQFNPS